MSLTPAQVHLLKLAITGTAALFGSVVLLLWLLGVLP
jgi:hypothetical protein